MFGKQLLIAPIVTLILVLPSLGAGTQFTGHDSKGKEMAPAAAKPPAPAVKPPALKPPAPAVKPPAPTAAKPPAPPVNPNYGKGNPAQNQVAYNPLPPNPPQPYGSPPPNWQQQAAVFLHAVAMASAPGYIGLMHGMQWPGTQRPASTSDDSSAEQREMILKVASTVSVTALQTRPGGGSSYRNATFDVLDQDQSVTIIVRPAAGAAINGNSWRLTGKVISADKDGNPKQLTIMAKVDGSTAKLDVEKVLVVSITVTSPTANK